METVFKNMTRILPFSILIIVGLSLNSCKKDKKLEGTDKELYDLAKGSSGFTWYKYSSDLLDRSSGSGHSQPFLRTRYNSIAAASLDSTGRIKQGSTFAEGSLVVKELYSNATTLGRYAILYKDPGSADADANGWVWGYIEADGTVVETASKKGISCTGCHSQIGNIDYMLMDVYFP